ncbi:MAG TPA: hypothetical protein VEG84_06335, partial [Thermoanaerobaculia bacterium]|nr:hypothetical protein [Thermoanaerobaculia bacterium]
MRPPSGSIRAEEGFWVAVLPFKYGVANTDLAALADGLTEEIVTGLARFSYLRVIARGSTAKYSGEASDIRAIGKELGARYMMEGSIRQAGTKLRLAVQLVDATTGAQLWAENFERTFAPEAVFELQDDLAPRIVSTVADMAGVLPRSMSESLRSRPPEQLTPYEAVLRSFGYFERYSPEELASARSGLEAAVRKAPTYADAWAMLSYLCAQDYVHGYDLQPDALEAAASAARRAVELGPSNHLSYFSLAQSLSYQKDFDSFRHAAERAVELNPMDGSSVALLGELLLYAGSAERGMQLAERAKRLNPIHAGGYYYADFYHAFSRGDDRAALDFALKSKLRGNPLAPMFIAAASGQLGETDQGSKAVRDLLKFRPELPALMRKQVAKIWNPEYGERFLDGLRKAGLEIPAEGPAAATAPRSSAADSGVARADEGFRVAVLPFKYGGADASLRTLAEGLSEEIVTGLSRFSYLRVIARSAAAGEGSSGRNLGARYLMEGSLRQAGSTVRVAVQLVDATTGTHLWAETFDRAFRPDEALALQDELVPRIVSTVADMNGVLPRSMSEAVRSRAPEQLSPYEAVLRSFGYLERVTPEELGAARSGLESAVEKAPGYADAWAMLAFLCLQDYAQGFELKADSLAAGLAAARRAVEAAPSNPLAHFSLAQAFFFQKEYQSVRSEAERVVALNPMDGNSIAFMGELLTYAGDRERGLALAGRAKQLNPNHPGWYWYTDFNDAYRRGDDRGALDFMLKANLPGHWGMHMGLAAVYGQLGERKAAAKALKDLLKLRPDIAATVRRDSEKWWAPDHVERILDGLRKAGLEIGERTEAPAATKPSDSGAVRGDEGFWVAVLPFKHGGGAELEALAGGMTEEIVTGLSRFPYLRVISRSSTSRYADVAADVRTIARELGARFVIEGSLRQAGAQLRAAVQLVDATTGAHLWAETYTRPFQADQVFAIQDDLVSRIVSTTADHFGVLARTISDTVRGKPGEQLSPYEALMRGFGYHFRLSPEEHAQARDVLEKAVELAPTNADCWAMLSWVYSHEHAHGFNPRPGSLDRALAAARRAVDLAPTNPLAQQALAVVLFFRKETAACLAAAERAIALNPLDGSNEAIFLIIFTGGWDRGLSLLRWAIDVNPNHPRWYELILGINEYRLGRYRAAVDEIVKANLPETFWKSMILAAVYGQLGDRDAARDALRDLLAKKPDFGESGAEFL